MTVEALNLDVPPAPAEHGGQRERLRAAVDRALGRIAPLWPLRAFVAVNPFHGLADSDFPAAAQMLARTAGARVTLPRELYREALAAGRITPADLEAALARLGPHPGLPETAEGLVAIVTEAGGGAAAEPPSVIETVADAAARVTGQDWPGLVLERIAQWAAAYFDQGQAAWRSPWRTEPAYAAWRQEAMIDRTPELLGLRGFRQAVRGLPEAAEGAIAAALARLGVPAAGIEAYCHRLLASIGGWAAYARYLGWQAELQGGRDDTLQALLAVRLAWEVVLMDCLGEDARIAAAWRSARERLAAAAPEAPAPRAVAIDAVLQAAWERSFQRALVGELARAPQAAAGAARASVQAVFCIDVRSEVFRRALERASPRCETLGFAGFFGFAVEHVGFGERRGTARCPVLLAPGMRIGETVRGATAAELERLTGLRHLRQRIAGAWNAFKLGAVSSFAYVETLGLTYVIKLATDGLGLTRAVPHPAARGLGPEVRARLEPALAPGELAGQPAGLDAGARVETAAAMLRGMSLTSGFARLVLLAGHGSTNVNNPHAAGLDCGACGGHSGEANARIAARVLNDPDVRAGLAERGIAIPEDTWFLAALHDTTTDEVRICDRELAPASHGGELEQLERWLAEAGRLARAERAPALGCRDPRRADAHVRARSRDWSQVRPEWGLAGCAAFIAAPRRRTAGLDLGGRAFLHSYEWRQDEGFATLELIMTAPMVVAAWINLQYYGSAVDNAVLGSGNKVLHNVVGTIGVLEGNGGDLRAGLPWQSVHDGRRLVHEPLRLSVFIEAPPAAMNEVIARHEPVRQLLDNDWVYLFALGEQGEVTRQYSRSLQWLPAPPPAETPAS